MEPPRKRRHELGVDKPSKEQQWSPALMQQGCDWLRDWVPALQAVAQWPSGVQRWPFYVVMPNSPEFQSQGSSLLLQPPTPLPSAAGLPLEASLPSTLSPSSSGHSRHSNPSTPPQRSAQQAAPGGCPPRAKRVRSAAAVSPSGLDALLAAAASLERSDGGAAAAAAAEPRAAEQPWGCPSQQPPCDSSWAAGAAPAALPRAVLPPRSGAPVAARQQQQLLQAAQSLLGYLDAHPAAAAPQPQPQRRQEPARQRKRKEPPAAACSAGAEPSLDAQQGIPSWPGLAGREGSMSDTSTGTLGFAFPASGQRTASPARMAPAAAGAAAGAPRAASGVSAAAGGRAKGAKGASPLLPAELAALPPELACKAAALVPLLEQGMGMLEPLPGGQPQLSPQLAAQLAEAMNSTARAVALAARRAYRAQGRSARAARVAAARG